MFTFSADIISSSQTVTITASYGGTSAQAGLTVTPIPAPPTVSITGYPVPTFLGSPVLPGSITAGPDGALWFTESIGNNIDRITTAGVVTKYPIPSGGSDPVGITAGPDGALWFTESNTTQGGEFSKIGRITTDGTFTEYAVRASSQPYGIVTGPDGALWFTEFFGNRIGLITTDGVITEYPAPTAAGLLASRRGRMALWFTEYSGYNIGRITTDGVITGHPLPQPAGCPVVGCTQGITTGITTGPDGAL